MAICLISDSKGQKSESSVVPESQESIRGCGSKSDTVGKFVLFCVFCLHVHVHVYTYMCTNKNDNFLTFRIKEDSEAMHRRLSGSFTDSSSCENEKWAC